MVVGIIASRRPRNVNASMMARYTLIHTCVHNTGILLFSCKINFNKNLRISIFRRDTLIFLEGCSHCQRSLEGTAWLSVYYQLVQ